MKSEQRIAVGELIRERRLILGWSQRRLAKKAGITPSYLSQVEIGNQSAHVATLKLIIDALELPMAAVLQRVGLMPDEEPADVRGAIELEPDLSSRQKRVLRDLYDLFVETNGSAARLSVVGGGR